MRATPVQAIALGVVTMVGVTACGGSLRPTITVKTAPVGVVYSVDPEYVKIVDRTLIVIDTEAPVEEIRTSDSVLFVRVKDPSAPIGESGMYITYCARPRPSTVLRLVPRNEQGEPLPDYEPLHGGTSCFVLLERPPTKPQQPESPPSTTAPVPQPSTIPVVSAYVVQW